MLQQWQQRSNCCQSVGRSFYGCSSAKRRRQQQQQQDSIAGRSERRSRTTYSLTNGFADVPPRSTTTTKDMQIQKLSCKLITLIYVAIVHCWPLLVVRFVFVLAWTVWSWRHTCTPSIQEMRHRQHHPGKSLLNTFKFRTLNVLQFGKQ